MRFLLLSYPYIRMSSSTYNNLLISTENHILTITINRPDKLNALNVETISELKTVMEDAYGDSNVRGIILTGAGQKSFVAGADISEIARLNQTTGQELAERGSLVFNLIEACPKPVIAAVNGFALGGGCELAMACHMRIASENACFGQPEVNLGLIPGYGGTQRLTQLIGKGKALELLLTGDTLNAEEAHRLGLANHVTTLEDLLPRCNKILNKITGKGPLAVGMVIESVNAYFDNTRNGFETETELFGKCFTTQDFKEGTSAFMEKRKPQFAGA